MPTKSCFFNLLEDLHDRFPQLQQYELAALGSYIWKQMTWEEKYPYMVKAWRSVKTREKNKKPSHSTAEIKLDFNNRLKRFVDERSANRQSPGVLQFLKIISAKIWNHTVIRTMDSCLNGDDQKPKQLKHSPSNCRTMKRLQHMKRHLSNANKSRTLK